MATTVGALRHRITIETKTRGASDGAGGYQSETWTTFKRLWASYEASNGREVVIGDRVQHIQTIKFMVRRRTDITTAMRVTYAKQRTANETDKAFTDRGGRIFAIVGLRDLEDGGWRWTEITADEGAPS